MADNSEQGGFPEEEIMDGQSGAEGTDTEKDRLSAGTEHAAQAEDTAAHDQADDTAADAQPDEDEMNAMIEQLCVSKAEEFRLIGYEHVNGQDVWECVSDKYHKKGTPPLYQVVNDILSLKVTQFMNYITLNMYRGDHRG